MKKWCKHCFIWLFAVLLAASFVQKAEAKTGNTPGNITNSQYDYAGNLCRSGKYVYYNIYNKLYRFDTTTRKTKLVKKLKGFSMSAINIYKGKFYMTVNKYMGTAYTEEYIYRMNKNGSGLKKLAKGRNCMVVDDAVYYIKTKIDKKYDGDISVAICKMKLNGSGKKTLWNQGEIWGGMYVSGGRIYFSSGEKIYSMKKDGSDCIVDYEPGSNRSLLGSAGGYYYYIDRGSYNNYVYRKKSIDSYGEYVATVGDYVTLEGNKLYYVIRAYDTTKKAVVYEKNLKTGKVKKIKTGKGLVDIHVAGNWMYIGKYTGYKGKTNFLGLMMTTKGKKVKKLRKYYVS